MNTPCGIGPVRLRISLNLKAMTSGLDGDVFSFLPWARSVSKSTKQCDYLRMTLGS